MSKCCGTCKWWKEHLYDGYGRCDWIDRYPPLSRTAHTTNSYDGDDCPLYEQKDGEKE